MKKMFFLYNSHAGKGQIRGKLASITDLFTKAGYMVTSYPTQCALDGYDKVCGADGQYDIIVCSGGDGTLNEVISALMTHRNKRPPVGYIPAGSTNDFAATLGISRNMQRAAGQIAGGVPFACDIGKMNGRYFNYVAAFGLFTEVSYKTPQNMKNMLGHQAYLFESLKSLSKIKAYSLKVSCNDMEIKGNYIYGMVSNSFSIGGMKGISGQGVLLDDGLFEVTLVKEPVTPHELQQVVAGIFSKSQTSPMVERFKTSSIIVESEEALAWTVDGENADSHQRVEISVARTAVEIVVDSSQIERISSK
ncbi:MAG: diacylglycerol kinase family lipid kinase [Butyrivibrio sp.]|nr:diacylglycerol kinase family lipid kinase [Butyrivibrio sp.]